MLPRNIFKTLGRATGPLNSGINLLGSGAKTEAQIFCVLRKESGTGLNKFSLLQGAAFERYDCADGVTIALLAMQTDGNDSPSGSRSL